MSSGIDVQTETYLSYQWLSANGVDFKKTCDLLHNGSCSFDQLVKLTSVAKVAVKYYIPFHFIPLILRLRKCKDRDQVIKLLKKAAVEYVRSVLFVTFLVTGMKSGQCISVHADIPYAEGSITMFALISGLSIFFQENSRRNQIGYFVAAKALRSTYTSLKRMKILSMRRQFCVMHMVLMSAIYYIYCNQPKILKFKNIFEMILGD